MYTLKNDKNITVGVDAWIKDNHKIISMSWFLPSYLTTNQLKDFFNKEFPRHLELPGIFYGNKRGLDNGYGDSKRI